MVLQQHFIAGLLSVLILTDPFYSPDFHLQYVNNYNYSNKRKPVALLIQIDKVE